MSRCIFNSLLLVSLVYGCPTRWASADTSALKNVSSEYHNLLVIPDPLPHLKSLLTNPALRKEFTEGSLAEMFAAVSPTGAVDPLDGWTAISQNQQFVPDEIVIAAPEGAMDSFDRIIRSALLAGLCYASNAVPDADGAQHRPGLRSELITQLGQLQLPPLAVWCNFRDAEVPNIIFQTAKLQVPAVLGRSGLSTKVDEDSIGVQGAVGDMVPAATLPIILHTLGIVTEDAEDDGRAMADAIAAIEIEARLERVGSGLRLSIGPTPQSQQAAWNDSNLNPLYQTSPAEIAFAQWNVRRLRANARQWTALWSKWEATAIGRRLAADDAEDSLGDLKMIARTLEATGDTGAMRVWTQRDALRAKFVVNGAPAAPDLRSAELLKFVPANAEALLLNSRQSFAGYLSDLLFDFEDRMARQSLKQELGGREAQAAMTERISSNYYRHFDRFRQLVHHKLETALDAPTAILISSSGRIQQAEVKLPDFDAARPIVLKDLPLVEIAAVGPVADADQAKQLAADVYRAFVEGVAAVAEKDLDAGSATATPQDIGLGVDAFVYGGSWLQQVAGQQVDIQLKGDFKPHYLLVDNHLIWSTSPRLTRQLLESAGRIELSLPGPLAKAPGLPVGYGLIPGGTIGNIYASIVEIVAQAERSTRASGPGTGADTLDAVALAIRGMAGLVDRLEWVVYDQGPQRTTNWAIRFSLDN